MDYYSILNLYREPFSNSPDPEYFFKSRQHFSCLQKVELALRLRRGLNVIIGEVGTGKTTLCRQLLQRLSKDDQMETHLILDPSFDHPFEFLARVTQLISGKSPPAKSDQWHLKELIKHQLFRKGIEEEKIISLIIDEGQKLPPFCIEILREFLNYETNEFKLLQIVLFAQQEFVRLLVEHSNFSDRVNFFTTLAPLNFQDTRLLIEYRLKQSSGTAPPPSLFTWPAYWAIYQNSRGYPRKIIHLCHQSMLAMIIQNRRKIGYSLVQSCARRAIPPTQKGNIFRKKMVVTCVAGILICIFGLLFNQLKPPSFRNSQQLIASGISHHPIPSVTKQTDVHPVTTSPTTSKIQGESASKNIYNPKDYDTKSDLNASVKKKIPPFILGTLKVNGKDNLIDLIKFVHGKFSSEYQETLLTLNPHLNSPNNISDGTVILFPALAVELPQVQRDIYRIEFDNLSNLGKARDIFFSMERKFKNIRMVAYWNTDKELRFSIFLRELFFDQNSAKDRLNSIKSIFDASLKSPPKIVNDWDKNTLFFSDPYNQ